MIEPGRGAAYAALFSEIGLSLLVTTLIGVLAGRWVDAQLGTLPVFVILGFLAAPRLPLWASAAIIVVLELMFAVSVTHGILSSIAFRQREVRILSASGSTAGSPTRSCSGRR